MCSCIGIKHALSFALFFVKYVLLKPYVYVLYCLSCYLVVCILVLLIVVLAAPLHLDVTMHEFELGLLYFLRSCIIRKYGIHVSTLCELQHTRFYFSNYVRRLRSCTTNSHSVVQECLSYLKS